MADEEHFLDGCEKSLSDTEPHLAFQIRRILQRKQLINAQHRKRLSMLTRLNQFSGSLTVGRHNGPTPGIKCETQAEALPTGTIPLPEQNDTVDDPDIVNGGDDDEQLDEDFVEELRTFISLFNISGDDSLDNANVK